MADKVAFVELSARLSGLYDPLLNDPEDRALNVPIDDALLVKLRATQACKAFSSAAQCGP